MNPNKILLNTTLLILTISGLNGFLFEEGVLYINRSFLSFILDLALFIVAIFSIKNTKQIRILLLIFFVFLILTMISFILNASELTAINYLNGFREFIPYFLFPVIYLNLFQSSQRFFLKKKFDVFLYFFLILQILVSLYQYSIHGSGDMVGGTQGKGYSGMLTLIIFLATYYLMTQEFDEENIIKSFFRKSYLLIFWIPSFINETKISFILIALFFLLLIKPSTANIYKYIYIVILLIPFIFAFNFIYQNTTEDFNSDDFLNSEYIDEYLTSDNEKFSDIPRLQKIALYINNFNKEEILFGKGIGQFKGGSTLSITPFAAEYDWLLNGSVPMLFYLLVQIGIIGIICFFVFWIFLIFSKQNNQQGVNYSTNLIIYTTGYFIIIQLYSSSFRFLFFCGIIMYIICYAISQNNIKSRLSNANSHVNELQKNNYLTYQ